MLAREADADREASDGGVEGVGPGRPETYWKELVDSLSESERRQLLNELRIPVPGFRQQAKIPDPPVRAALENAPLLKKGRPFITWFRLRHTELVEALETDSDDELVQKRSDWIDQYPSVAICLALSLFRPDLLPEWEPIVREGNPQSEEDLKAVADRLLERSEELATRVAELEKTLNEEQRDKQKLQGENRRLERQVRDLQQRLNREQTGFERKLAGLQEEIQKLRKLHQETVLDAHKTKEELHQTLERNREHTTLIGDLQKRIERYKVARYENDNLLRLYGSMADVVDTQTTPDLRALVLGTSFTTQAFLINDRIVHIQGLEATETLTDSLIELCAGYDQVFLLSSCPYSFRMDVYQVIGKVIEIPSLNQIRHEFELEGE